MNDFKGLGKLCDATELGLLQDPPDRLFVAYISIHISIKSLPLTHGTQHAKNRPIASNLHSQISSFKSIHLK